VFHVFLIPEFLFPPEIGLYLVDVGLAIIQMRKCQLTTIFTGILDNPILKLKLGGGGEKKNICVHHKVTLRTSVSALDFAMLIVLQLG
jgi:hypothetical protein